MVETMEKSLLELDFASLTLPGGTRPGQHKGQRIAAGALPEDEQ